MNGASTPSRSGSLTNSYTPSEVKITIDGQIMDAAFFEDILDITVEESLHLPSVCTLVINNDYFPGRQQDPPWQHEKKFELGKSLKIAFINSTTADPEFGTKNEATIFDGEITGIEAHFIDHSQAPTIVRAYDLSHRLHRGRFNRSFLNTKDSDIARKIAGEAGITPGTIDDSGIVHEYAFQENQTNMEFLRERAARIGFELFVQDGKLNFRKPNAGATLDLKWLRDFNSFHVRVTSAEQVPSVEVRGWDYRKKQEIVATATNEQLLTKIAATVVPPSPQQGSFTYQPPQGSGQRKGSQSSTKFKINPKLVVVNQPVFDGDTAKKMAQAICDELGGEFVAADARAEGNPLIRSGKIASLEGMGPYDGNYYITETRHIYRKRVYKTEFTVRGLRGGHLLNQLSPQSQLQPGQGFLAGIVTDNKDPEGMGRVKVKFPTLTNDHASNWARVVGLGAGNTRGFYCLPEVNDEVLVGFEHGDIHRPYIVSGVWNGKDKTPDSIDDTVVGGKVRLRTIKTRTGHVLQFIEEPKGSSKAGILITTTGGHKIYLNDTDKHIEVKTTGGHTLKMDDMNKKITLTSTTGHNLEMNDAGASVTLSSVGTMTIKANATMTLQAPMIKLN